VNVDKPPEIDKEVYLGDSVYLSYDGYQIWLRTGNHRLALEFPTMATLFLYAKVIYGPGVLPP
jgi:hypothetical protein